MTVTTFYKYFNFYKHLLFQKEISNKVDDVLKKTPLEILPRRELPRFGKSKNIKTAPLIDLESNVQPPHPENKTTIIEEPFVRTVQMEQIDANNVLDFEFLEKPNESPPKTPHNTDLSQGWELKQTTSMELLTPSPLGFGSFDTKSIDDLMTPDEFATDNLAPGLGNINYDIDLSDFSGENSIAEDVIVKPEPKDPFSPIELKQNLFNPSTSFDPFSIPQAPRDPFSPILEPFNNFTVNNQRARSDPFSPIPGSSFSDEPFSPFVANDNGQVKDVSILDDNDLTTVASLLPSPLQPHSVKESGPGDKVS